MFKTIRIKKQKKEQLKKHKIIIEEIRKYLESNTLLDYFFLDINMRDPYRKYSNFRSFYEDDATEIERKKIEDILLFYFHNGDEDEFYLSIFCFYTLNYKLVVDEIYEMIISGDYYKHNKYTRLFMLEMLFMKLNKNDIDLLLQEYDNNDSLINFFWLIGDYDKPNCVTDFDLFMLNKFSEFYIELDDIKKEKVQQDFLRINYNHPKINTLFEIYLLKNKDENFFVDFVRSFLLIKNQSE